MICPACHRPMPPRVVVDAETVVDMFELRITDEWMHHATEPVLYVVVETENNHDRRHPVPGPRPAGRARAAGCSRVSGEPKKVRVR